MAVRQMEVGPVPIWDRAGEMMPREERRALQLGRMRRLVDRLYRSSPFYRQALQEKGIKPEDLRSLEDVQHLPFTRKKDVVDNYPFGLFAVPLEQIVRLQASSGTTGKPVVGGYTAHDVEMWAEVCARALVSAGIGRGDIVQNTHGYGLFTGGLGMHYGAEKIGAMVIPMSTGFTERQVMFMQDLGTTALVATPSYALVIAEKIAELGVPREQLKLRVGIGGAEPSTEEMRQSIQAKLGVKWYDIYGLMEVIGPGVAVECVCQDGLHIQEDHFYPEIIDPETGKVLPPGEKGELVLTTLTKEGMPVLRYRTGDITYFDDTPCPCGRTTVRMHKIIGRADDMLVIRGINVFPSQVETVILRHKDEIEPQYQIIVDRVKNLDEMEVQVEASEAFWAMGEAARENLAKQLETELQQVLLVHSKVTILAPKTLARIEAGKARRVVDKRKF